MGLLYRQHAPPEINNFSVSRASLVKRVCKFVLSSRMDAGEDCTVRNCVYQNAKIRQQKVCVLVSGKSRSKLRKIQRRGYKRTIPSIAETGLSIRGSRVDDDMQTR